MRIIIVSTIVAQLAGCAFAVKHPAVTAGIVAGTIGLGSCELASAEHKQCFMISGIAGVGLALITAGALWLGYEDEAAPTAGRGQAPTGDPTNLEPAPVFVPKPKLVPPPAPKPEPEPKPEPAPDPKPEPVPEPAPTP